MHQNSRFRSRLTVQMFNFKIKFWVCGLRLANVITSGNAWARSEWRKTQRRSMTYSKNGVHGKTWTRTRGATSARPSGVSAWVERFDIEPQSLIFQPNEQALEGSSASASKPIWEMIRETFSYLSANSWKNRYFCKDVHRIFHRF